MKLSLTLCCLFLAFVAVNSSPLVKREAAVDDLSPLNENKIRATTAKNKIRTTTEEDIPEFDRTKVSLDIPPQIFGGGFTLITNISKIISSLIMNSAKRTESVLEVFKPIFRGTFAIKGLPSDNPK